MHAESRTWKLKHWYSHKVEACNFGKLKSLFFPVACCMSAALKRKCRYWFGTIQSFLLCEKRVVPPIKIPLNCPVWELIIRQNYELCHKLIKYPQRKLIFIYETHWSINCVWHSTTPRCIHTLNLGFLPPII